MYAQAANAGIRLISFPLHLRYASGDGQDTDTAVQLAAEAVAKHRVNGWFKGHPAKPYYESKDSVGYLLYALKQPAACPKRLPSNL